MSLSWTIPSNSGHDSFTCKFERLLPSPLDIVLCEIAIATEFIDRASDKTCKQFGRTDRSSYLREHRVELNQILINRHQLTRLGDCFQSWLSDQLPFRFDLAAEPGQTISMRVGPSPNLISSIHHPALIIEYAGIGLDFTSYTVIDQSCVQCALDDLHRALELLDSQPR